MKTTNLIAAFLLFAGPAGLARAEELGPFASTPAAPVAPGCRAPKVVQRNPAVAFGKKVYLVAWCDGSRQPVKDAADIYVARVEPKTGKALDPKGILVCEAEGIQGYPAVAFDGTNFLVAWEDFRNGKDYDVYAARVSEDGKVLDEGGFPVAVRADNQARPAVGFAGGNYLVAWMDGRRYPVYGIYAARVSSAGKCLDIQGIELDAEDQAKIDKVKPKDGKWLGDKERWWRTLGSCGTPVIASNGKRCLVAYNKEVTRVNANTQTAVLLVDPVTGKRAGEPVVLKDSNPEDRPAATATPVGWAVSLDHWIGGWGCTPTISCARLDAALKTADAFGRRGNPNAPHEAFKDGAYAAGKGQTTAFQPAIAWNGKRLVLAQDLGWRPKDQGPFSAILLNRCEAAGPPKLLDAKSVRVDAGPERGGVFVANCALAAGPGGECLLVYERDAGVADCKVVGRVIRER